MIPDEIKARFFHEYIKSSNLEAVRRELAAGLRGPAGPPPDFRVHMIAALETVAADIWDEGFTRGVDADGIDASLHETREIDLNPYRASETA